MSKFSVFDIRSIRTIRLPLKRLLFSSTRSHGGHGGPRRFKKVVANWSFMIDNQYVEYWFSVALRVLRGSVLKKKRGALAPIKSAGREAINPQFAFSSTRSHGGHGGTRRTKNSTYGISIIKDRFATTFLTLRGPPCPPWLRVEEKRRRFSAEQIAIRFSSTRSHGGTRRATEN